MNDFIANKSVPNCNNNKNTLFINMPNICKNTMLKQQNSKIIFHRYFFLELSYKNFAFQEDIEKHLCPFIMEILKNLLEQMMPILILYFSLCKMTKLQKISVKITETKTIVFIKGIK